MARLPRAVRAGLAMLLLLIRASRLPDAVLGRIPEMRGFHDVAYHDGAATIPGLVLHRFGGGIVFFNAPYFRRRVLEALAAKPGAKWFVVDGAPIVHIDSTGADTIAALAHELETRGVRPAVANLRWPARAMLKRAGSIPEQGASSIFEILNSAIRAFQAGQSETERAASNVEDQKARQSFMAGPHEVGDDCLSPKANGHMFRLQVQALRPLESARMTGT